MEQYNVTGMTCAACQARVEKVVSKVPGVTSVSVSLLTNSMGVEGTALSTDIVAAVEKAGYHASVKGAEKESSQGAEALADTETPKLLKRLIISLIFLMPLMYLSMGHMMWNWPLPGFINNNHVIILYTQKMTMHLKVISAYAVKAQDQMPITFANETQKKEYITKIRRMSEPSIKLDDKKIDRIYTFVTCSYERDDNRTYVYAVEE